MGISGVLISLAPADPIALPRIDENGTAGDDCAPVRNPVYAAVRRRPGTPVSV